MKILLVNSISCLQTKLILVKAVLTHLVLIRFGSLMKAKC